MIRESIDYNRMIEEINDRFREYFARLGRTIDIFLSTLANPANSVDDYPEDGIQILDEETGKLKAFGDEKGKIAAIKKSIKIEGRFVMLPTNEIIYYDDFDAKSILSMIPVHLNFEKTIEMYNFSKEAAFKSNNIPLINLFLSFFDNETRFDYLYYYMIDQTKSAEIRQFATIEMVKLIGVSREMKNRCVYYILELENQSNRTRILTKKLRKVLDADMIEKLNDLRGISPVACRETFETCPQCRMEVCADVEKRMNIRSCERCWNEVKNALYYCNMQN